ncbi:MAG: NADH-quinone oxidoreductase subunit N [Candidatus Sericytochromatia bacterium]|nr:MAG: NADH-quinone oxidoreductase subunit N [Candidatus Sericytochromatia bacterium]
MNLNFGVFTPEIILLLTACIVVFGEWAFKSVDGNNNKKNRNIGFVTLLGLTITLAILISFKVVSYGLPTYLGNLKESTFWGSFVLDDLSIYFKIIIVFSAIMTVLISFRYVNEKIIHVGEFYALLCLATIGGMFMSSAAEMITFYLGIELISITSYVLCAFNKDNQKSSESGLKYLVVGSLSSALLLYGFSLLFGLTGKLNFEDLALALEKFTTPLNTIYVIAIMMTLAGISYKIAAVPFHMWAPDVYEGAPTPVTAFLAITSKIAGFAAFIRFLEIFNLDVSSKLIILIAILSVVTMTIGNVLAIVQTNLKRLFAYSSIAHAGYLMIGFIPLLQGKVQEVSTILFYLTAYIFMNIGAFASIIYFSKYTGSTDIDSFSGVAKKAPFFAFVFSACLVSLAGLPPFGGFTGKFYLFVSAVNSGYTWLAFVGALNSVISLYFYVRIIKVMYFKDNKEDLVLGLPNAASLTAAIISLVGILILFLVPSPFIQMAIEATTSL